jgi:hypothetical protein
MPVTYPPAGPSISGDNVTISRFLNNPTLVARRLRTLLEQRYIADTLLSGRYDVAGGAVQYESSESIYSTDSPRSVKAGAEYPLTTIPTGVASIAKTVKWGQDTFVTDESIARQNIAPVNKALIKLANQNVKYVDSVALSAISSAVTQTTAATAAWTSATAAQILLDVAKAKANLIALNQGYAPDTVVLSDLAWAYAKAAFVAGGFMPREGSNNPAVTGDFPLIDGMLWLTTPNLPTANTGLILDRSMLGGMADEDLGGPGYASAGGVGVQVKTMREDSNDQWKLRCRRVTVPIVNEPNAGWKLTGLGV